MHHFLIIEHNPDVTLILQSILTFNFITSTVQNASNSTEAIELLTNKKPDAIICSYGEHLSLSNEIINYCTTMELNIPIIIISADPLVTREQIIELGATDFISKNDIVRELPSLIKNLLKDNNPYLFRD